MSRTQPQLSNEVYRAGLSRLQTEFVKFHEWVRKTGARVEVFEGRDTAGKGGTIKRITEYLRPRVPIFEQMLIDWFSVSEQEQLRRFRKRRSDPLRQWKLSPMDLESVCRWEDYSRPRDEMMVHTDIPQSPWYVVESDSKKHARLNMMAHLLSTLPYQAVEHPKVQVPECPVVSGTYQRPARDLYNYVDDHVATLLGDRE